MFERKQRHRPAEMFRKQVLTHSAEALDWAALAAPGDGASVEKQKRRGDHCEVRVDHIRVPPASLFPSRKRSGIENRYRGLVYCG
jgi:hypothetical protein